jgi:GGDEF domain-containing protein
MAIAACYLDIAGFKPYCAAKGKEGQERALAFMAGLLRQLPRTLGIYEWSIAHLGGEHFVALLNLEDYERFCSAVCQEFDQRKAELYTEKELEEGCVTAKDKSGREAKYRLMALAIGVAHTQFRRFKSAKKMFEVLAQTRQKAQPDNRSTVFVDRRRTDR